MGCFPACFGHLRRVVTTKKVQDQCLSPSDEQHESIKLLPDKTEPQEEEEEIVNPVKLISESEYECNEENPALYHSNVKKDTNEVASSNSDKLVVNETGEAEKESDIKGGEDEPGSNFSRPAQDSFLINDKECAAADAKEARLECSPVQEESCGSLFSLSIDSRKHVYAAEMGEKEVSSSPFKMNTALSKYDEEKEKVPFSKDPMITQAFDKSKPTLSDHQRKRRDGETAVETSLSSWLVESEKSPQKLSVGSSPESEKNYGDRLLLGVNASAEIKELNGQSPCCSADNNPSIGTVGRYWQQSGHTVDGEDLSPGSSRDVTV